MSKKILIVDDSKFNIRLLKDILEKEFYSVYSCQNSLKVVDTVYKIFPDVILLDIVMPGIDGFEVCRLLKKKEELKDIPVIIISAKTDSNDLKKALELGAFDYIKKPIDEVEVAARVNSAIRFKLQQDKLKELAMKDGLTGLYNHNSLIQLFKKQYKNCKINNKDISFVMIDMDFFKKINDSHGHICGDMVIKQVSSVLKKSVRNFDIVGRYGGEEFSIVLPDMKFKEVFHLCENIRSSIENHPINLEGDIIKVTVSMGICHKSVKDNISEIEMIKMADKAVYKAKNCGRNRVEAELLN